MRRLHVLSAFLGIVALGLIGAIAGCGEQPTSVGTGTVRVQLTDDPASYDAVNLQVVEVAIQPGLDEAGSSGEDSMGDGSEWEVLSAESATYDLLTLRNGVFATLAVGPVPAGHYNQVRLKLGDGSTIVVDGVTHPLKVPSGMQSGLKLIGGFEVPEGGTVDIAIDFDASRSVVHTGADTYILKPTARVVVQPAVTTGSIRGTVDPNDVVVTAFAISGGDTVATAATQPGSGEFVLPMLAPGSYDVALHPSASYADTAITGVSVTVGTTTDLGTITLTPQ
jgi:hypothetical protein